MNGDDDTVHLAGYTLPLSPSGRSALVPPPPWHFSGDVLAVEYLADPATVRSFLPPGITPADPPGLAFAIFGDWQSCTDQGAELTDPVRSQYREFYVALAGQWEGDLVARCPFCWVDQDFSLVRGLIQGYPKKLGRIGITRLFDVGRATPGLRPGAVFGASLAGADRRLVEAEVTLRGPGEAPPLMSAPLVHTRLFPAWTPDAATVEELVTGGSTDLTIANVWTGDATLRFFESPVDELALLRPVEVLRGYRFSFAETIVGGRLLSGTAR